MKREKQWRWAKHILQRRNTWKDKDKLADYRWNWDESLLPNQSWVPGCRVGVRKNIWSKQNIFFWTFFFHKTFPWHGGFTPSSVVSKIFSLVTFTPVTNLLQEDQMKSIYWIHCLYYQTPNYSKSCITKYSECFWSKTLYSSLIFSIFPSEVRKSN